MTLVRSANRKLAELSGILSMLRYIRNSIDTLNRPMGEILAAYRNDDPAMAVYLRNVREGGLLHGAENSGLVIGAAGMELLTSFSERIGTGYREDALRLCTYTINGLEEILAKTKEETGKRMRMYKTLPVMSALSVGLLLL